MFENFERGTFDAGGTAISYVTAGQGPPVLLLHGFPQTKAMWTRVATLLARSYRVVAADLRGYGDSAKPECSADNSNYAFRAMAGDQAALMETLGHERFHVIGHDRGGRVAHRMTLDDPGRIISMSVLDIVPTHAMFTETRREVALAYWHWYFLAQPAPLPERLIGADPDFFFETCLVGWGKTGLDRFDPELLGEYRRCWRDPATIHGMVSDYRAAATVDFAHDSAGIATKVRRPALAFWGTKGVMAQLFDMEAAWRARCEHLVTETLPGGHFFVDQFPDETAAKLEKFISAHA